MLHFSWHVPISGHHDVGLFEGLSIINPKIDNYIILTSLKSETTCKLINRISGFRLLISSLPGKALRMHVESQGKPRDSRSIPKALLGKLDIKETHLPVVFSIYIFQRADNNGADQSAHCTDMQSELRLCCSHATKSSFLMYRPRSLFIHHTLDE